MKKSLMIAASVIVATTAMACNFSPKGNKEAEKTAESTELTAPPADETVQKMDGKLEDYIGKGQYVLVDFWASWCRPCREEIPNIVAVNEKYAGKGLVVLGVVVNDRVSDTKTAMKKLGVVYDQVLDPKGELATKYGVDGIPTIFLFSPEGKQLARGLRGAEIEKEVAKYIK